MPAPQRWEALRGPNLDAAYFTSAAFLPALANSAHGAIVNISSTATLHGNWGLYCVAKAGVEGLTRAFAAEGAPLGIRVNGVSPGWIATENDAAQAPSGTTDGTWQLPPSLLGRIGRPEEIAAAVMFLGSPDASFVTGQTLIVDGGLSITDYTSAQLLAARGGSLRSRPETP
jgi:NAD(P)-dependent dehydrogenase (short-subunit alcohol dehydrogenase family)